MIGFLEGMSPSAVVCDFTFHLKEYLWLHLTKWLDSKKAWAQASIYPVSCMIRTIFFLSVMMSHFYSLCSGNYFSGHDIVMIVNSLLPHRILLKSTMYWNIFIVWKLQSQHWYDAINLMKSHINCDICGFTFHSSEYL